MDTTYNTFIKQEPLYKGVPEGEQKVAFRVIQAASAEQTLLASTVVKPVVDAFKKLDGVDSDHWIRKYTYTSGMDSQQVGSKVSELLKEAEGYDGEYTIIENDFSAYDGS